MSTFDVAVIGAGVVGTAIARELGAYRLRVALIDRAADVGTGTSKANTAILHTGFDATPGTLEARLVRRGYERLRDYAARTGVPLEPTGALLVAWTEEQLASLPAALAKAAANEITDLEQIDPAQLYRLEPNLGPGALGGLRIAGEGIVCPYTPPLAYARDALAAGVELFLESPVVELRGAATHVLVGPNREIEARYVVNAAGLFSDEIDNLFGHRRFAVRPRRGELIVYDKQARALLRHVLLPVPTKTTKGVLVAPTVFGNVLLGPTAEDLDDKDDRSTTARGVGSLLEKGRHILPALLDEEVTATYAGLRAATEHADYQIHLDAPRRYVCVGGIRSTGLTAALGIAEHVVSLLAEAGLDLERRPALPFVPVPAIGERDPRPYRDPARLRDDPNCGRIVCHCERVSLAEIQAALTGPLAAPNLDGLRRRTRCLQGRCQGFNCLARVGRLLADARGISIEQVLGVGAGDP